MNPHLVGLVRGCYLSEVNLEVLVLIYHPILLPGEHRGTLWNCWANVSGVFQGVNKRVTTYQ